MVTLVYPTSFKWRSLYVAWMIFFQSHKMACFAELTFTSSYTGHIRYDRGANVVLGGHSVQGVMKCPKLSKLCVCNSTILVTFIAVFRILPKQRIWDTFHTKVPKRNLYLWQVEQLPTLLTLHWQMRFSWIGQKRSTQTGDMAICTFRKLQKCERPTCKHKSLYN